MLKSVRHIVKDRIDNKLYDCVVSTYHTHWPLSVIVDSLDIIIADRILNEVWFYISDKIHGS